MFHVEIRQFPHSAWRFNLGEAELRAVVDPWVREKVVEFGERKWMPYQATLTIIEGPRLAVQQLSMGRGWRAAQSGGEDITERVLAAATQAIASAAEAQSAAAGVLGDPLALGVQIASLLGADPTSLLETWRAVAADSPGMRPSEALAIAEQRIESLESNSR